MQGHEEKEKRKSRRGREEGNGPMEDGGIEEDGGMGSRTNGSRRDTGRNGIRKIKEGNSD